MYKKGQLVFEFVIAGIVFFTILFFSINYLNSNSLTFRENAYQNYLQTKSLQISEILTNENSSLSLVDSSGFSQNKIDVFNNTFCKTSDGYKKLLKDLNLYKDVSSIQIPNNIKILLITEDEKILLDCGLNNPKNIQKAEITRINLYNNKIAKLNVVVW
ncbi:MAG: hypothetical protein QW051_01775 [Candidatus Aenigmatarchaeota archaeon]